MIESPEDEEEEKNHECLVCSKAFTVPLHGTFVVYEVC